MYYYSSAEGKIVSQLCLTIILLNYSAESFKALSRPLSQLCSYPSADLYKHLILLWISDWKRVSWLLAKTKMKVVNYVMVASLGVQVHCQFKINWLRPTNFVNVLSDPTMLYISYLLGVSVKQIFLRLIKGKIVTWYLYLKLFKFIEKFF